MSLGKVVFEYRPSLTQSLRVLVRGPRYKMGKKLEAHNFTAWAKSLKMLMYMFPVEWNYRYNIWHIIEGTLMYNQEEFVDIGLEEDE